MKSGVKFVLCSATLVGCAPPPPLSPKEVETAVFSSHVAQACIQKGWVTDLPSLVNYGAYQDKSLSGRASAEYLASIREYISKQYPAHGVTLQHCRAVQALAVELAQDEVKAQPRQQEFDASMDRPAATGQAMQQNALNSGPITCQHYQWGNTTFCN